MYECYQVLQPFKWRGWHYGPAGRHIKNEVDQESGEKVECDCDHFAGSIFVVEEGHPRKGWALSERKVRVSLGMRPPEYATDDEWVEADLTLKRLTQPPGELVGAATPPVQRKSKKNRR